MSASNGNESGDDEAASPQRRLVKRTRAALDAAIDRGAPVKEVVMSYVLYFLARFEPRKIHAAMRLGIDRRTIQRWLKESGSTR